MRAGGSVAVAVLACLASLAANWTKPTLLSLDYSIALVFTSK